VVDVEEAERDGEEDPVGGEESVSFDRLVLGARFWDAVFGLVTRRMVRWLVSGKDDRCYLDRWNMEEWSLRG
jgi:hypothetical protein